MGKEDSSCPKVVGSVGADVSQPAWLGAESPFSNEALAASEVRIAELERELRPLSHESLVHLAALAREGMEAYFRAFLAEELSRAEAEQALAEAQRRVEVFKGLFDRAMTFLERLGGEELPLLMTLRRRQEKQMKGLNERNSAVDRGPRDAEILKAARAGMKLDAIAASYGKGGPSRATIARVISQAKRDGRL